MRIIIIWSPYLVNGIVHMDVRTSDRTRLMVTLLSLLLGLAFYLFFRPQVFGFDRGLNSSLPNWLLDSFPSFIFMPLFCGLTLLSLKAFAFKSTILLRAIVLFWLTLVVIFEGLQAGNLWLLSRGTFDWQDILAAGFGAILVLIVFSQQPRPSSQSRLNPIMPLIVISLGLSSILGSVTEPCEGDDVDALCISPVVLSWQEIRQEIQPDISANQVLTRSGKIYSIDHWLLVVEKYRGIHIFDASDKQNPIRKAYLPIPGALDLTIKDGILYSSAFSDLVTLDLNLLLQSEGLDVSMARQKDVFAYPARQQFYPSYPEFYYTNYSERVSEDEGVVIGYKTKSGKVILYGDEYDFKKEEQRAEKEAEEDEIIIANPACVLFLSWMCGAN